MEELWYKKEEDENAYVSREQERREAANKPLIANVDEFIQGDISEGPWMFVSNIKNLRIVMSPSWRETDPVTKQSTYHQGKTIQFKVGRFHARSPQEVDFLISKRDFGSKFLAGFNIDEYRAWRRDVLGMPSREKPAMEKELSEVPVRELDVEEVGGYNTEELIGASDTIDSVKGSSIILPTSEETADLLAKPYSPPANERVEQLEDRMVKMEALMQAVADKILAPTEEAPVEEPEPMEEYVGIRCRKCGQEGFTSGNAVAQHRKNGECNRNIARKLASENAPQMTTGMSTVS